jgi:hypothetical protein
VGLPLTCARGIWNGKPPPSFTYQWYRDGVPITGAIEATYTIVPEDQGHLLTCNVIATNIVGHAEAESLNGIPVPGHRTLGGGVEGLKTGEVPPPVTASPGVILASIKRQLTTALENVRLRSVLKSRGFSFAFRPPADGKLDFVWYKHYKVKGARGSTKTRSLTLAQASTAYASIKQSTVRVKLTSAGKSALQGHKRVSILVKAVFTVPQKRPVVWLTSIVLS